MNVLSRSSRDGRDEGRKCTATDESRAGSLVFDLDFNLAFDVGFLRNESRDVRTWEWMEGLGRGRGG